MGKKGDYRRGNGKEKEEKGEIPRRKRKRRVEGREKTLN